MELRADSLESFIGTNLMQLGWCLPLLASDGESLIVWDKTLETRVGNSGGYGLCRVFSQNLNDVMAKALPESEEIRKILVNLTLREWFPVTIIQIRYSIAGGLEEEDFMTLLEAWMAELAILGLRAACCHVASIRRPRMVGSITASQPYRTFATINL